MLWNILGVLILQHHRDHSVGLLKTKAKARQTQTELGFFRDGNFNLYPN